MMSQKTLKASILFLQLLYACADSNTGTVYKKGCPVLVSGQIVLRIVKCVSLDRDRRRLVWGNPAVCFGAELESWAEDPRFPFSSSCSPPCLIWGGRNFTRGPLCCTREKQSIYAGRAAGVLWMVLGAWCCQWGVKGQVWPLGEVISGLQESPILLLVLSSWLQDDFW